MAVLNITGSRSPFSAVSFVHVHVASEVIISADSEIGGRYDTFQLIAQFLRVIVSPVDVTCDVACDVIYGIDSGNGCNRTNCMVYSRYILPIIVTFIILQQANSSLYV